jgi:hypothetical protein
VKAAGVGPSNHARAETGERRIRRSRFHPSRRQHRRERRLNRTEIDRLRHSSSEIEGCPGFEPPKIRQSSDSSRVIGGGFLWLGVRDGIRNWLLTAA